MLNITKIDFSELEKYIRLAFEDDPVLISKIHISPGTLDHCVQDTNTSLSDVVDHGGSYYKLEYDGKEIGFLAAIKEPVPLVISFGINIHSRKREVLQSFLVALGNYFDNTMYMVGVHSKNKRAISFFVKNGFEYFSGKNKTVYLVCPS